MQSALLLRSGTLFFLTAMLPGPAAALQDACVTRRMSLDTGGTDSDGISRKPSLSADGAWVAFESEATDLVAGDTNGFKDIFVTEVATGITERVSMAVDGGETNGDSYHCSISEDGRYVIYESDATNAVDGDGNGHRDVFVVDRDTDFTTRVSKSLTGAESNGPSGTSGLWRGSAISGDGQLAVFQSFASNLVPGDTNLLTDIFMHDLGSSTTVRVNMTGAVQANGSSQDPAISANGLFVAYRSSANNLVAGDTNGQSDIFRTQVASLLTVRTSTSTGGAQGNSSCGQPAISANGNFVAFESFADNIVAGDTNGQIDVFLRDVNAGTTERVSVAFDGSEGSGYAKSPSISAAGSRVAFTSNSIELIPSGSAIQSVYVRDTGLATTTRWGEDSAGGIGFAGSDDTSMSADGDRLAFLSLAVLEPNDGNSLHDIYLRECGPTGTQYCAGLGNNCPCGNGGNGVSGCANSTGSGGLLDATGVPSVFADSVVLTASGLPGTVPALFFQGPNALNGAPFGDGLRCVGGQTRRIGVRFAAGGIVTYGVGGDIPVSVRGLVPATGQTLRYQVWFRDPPAFCTASAFNLTNALTIHWAP